MSTIQFNQGGSQLVHGSSGAAIGAPITGGTPNEVLYIDASGNLAQSPFVTIDGNGALQAYALSAKGAYYQFPASPLPVDAAHNYLYAAIYDDGGGNGSLRIYSQQGPNYWNFMSVDSGGNEVSRMTMGDPGDGTVTFSSALWENAVFIIGGFGQGFGSTYMRLTSQFGQGAEFGDALGGQLNINNGTVFVNANGSGGNQGSNVIFQVQDNNFGIALQINRNDANAYGDYVKTLNNILDTGDGTSQFAGGLSCGNATPTTYTFQIGDNDQDTLVMFCDGGNQHFQMGDISAVNYGNILDINGTPGVLSYSVSGTSIFTIDNSNNFIISNSNLKLSTVGEGIYIKEGTNATMGVATLASGTVTVSTSKVTANSRIFLTIDGGTITNVGSTYVSSRTAGTSFVIKSTNILDASNVSWVILEPA